MPDAPLPLRTQFPATSLAPQVIAAAMRTQAPGLGSDRDFAAEWSPALASAVSRLFGDCPVEPGTLTYATLPRFLIQIGRQDAADDMQATHFDRFHGRSRLEAETRVRFEQYHAAHASTPPVDIVDGRQRALEQAYWDGQCRQWGRSRLMQGLVYGRPDGAPSEFPDEESPVAPLSRADREGIMALDDTALMHAANRSALLARRRMRLTPPDAAPWAQEKALVQLARADVIQIADRARVATHNTATAQRLASAADLTTGLVSFATEMERATETDMPAAERGGRAVYSRWCAAEARVMVGTYRAMAERILADRRAALVVPAVMPPTPAVASARVASPMAPPTRTMARAGVPRVGAWQAHPALAPLPGVAQPLVAPQGPRTPASDPVETLFADRAHDAARLPSLFSDFERPLADRMQVRAVAYSALMRQFDADLTAALPDLAPSAVGRYATDGSQAERAAPIADPAPRRVPVFAGTLGQVVPVPQPTPVEATVPPASAPVVARPMVPRRLPGRSI